MGGKAKCIIHIYVFCCHCCRGYLKYYFSILKSWSWNWSLLMWTLLCDSGFGENKWEGRQIGNTFIFTQTTQLLLTKKDFNTYFQIQDSNSLSDVFKRILDDREEITSYWPRNNDDDREEIIWVWPRGVHPISSYSGRLLVRNKQ